MKVLNGFSLIISKCLKSNNFRSGNIKKNVVGSFVVKGGNVIINLLMVPLLIDYLNPTKFGVWLTANSVITWFIFFDIGLGHGLRNRFAEKKAQNRDEEVKTYISTAYFSLSAIATIIFVLFFAINQFVDWTYLLNTDISLLGELSLFISIIFFFFALRFVLNLINSILLGDQRPALSGLLNFLGQFVALISLYVLTLGNSNSLIYVGLLFSGMPVIVLFLANIYFFLTKYRQYAPSLSFFKFDYLKSLMNLGSKFFIIEAAFIILYTTDNFIISHLFSPADVAPYNIAFRYFGIMTMLFSIVNTPFWSAYTEAFAKKDYRWIKGVNLKLKKIWSLFSIVIFVMILFSDFVYVIWIGNKITIPLELTIVMGINAVIAVWRSIFVYFLNGVGKVKLQTITAVIGAIIHIPLAIFFAKTLSMGVTGVILATVTTGIIAAILQPYQYYKIINQRAYGIWNA